jgi:hypothetical protein
MEIKYYTYILEGDFPLRENTPYLYSSREECVEDLIRGLRLLNDCDLPVEEWLEKKNQMQLTFDADDSFEDKDSNITYTVLECRLEVQDGEIQDGEDRPPEVSQNTED